MQLNIFVIGKLDVARSVKYHHHFHLYIILLKNSSSLKWYLIIFIKYVYS